MSEPIFQAPETAESFDDEDIPAMLEKDTEDGKGGAVVPSSDYENSSEEQA